MNKLNDGIRKKALAGVVILGIAAITTAGVFSIGKNGAEESPDPLVDLNSPENPDLVNGGEGNTDVVVRPPTVTVMPDGSGENQTADGKTPGKDTEGEGQTADGSGATEGNGTQTADGSDGEEKPDEPVQTADGNDGTQGSDGSDDKDDTAAVLSPQVIAERLTYQKEAGLLWPLRADVLIPYSPDHGVFHFTLEQFRTSNAIVLSSEVGTPVYAAAKGVVISIEDHVRTGKTVKMALGNDTYLVYGQLALDGLKEGDILEEGDCIGTVAEPTRYYVIEGPNLYFQVLEGETPVNPMMLLHEAE